MSKWLTRRNFAAAVAGVSATLPFGTSLRRASAAEFVYKCGHDLPDAHPLNVRLVEAAKRIGSETNGRMELRIFPNNQLGADPQMLSQLRSGALEFYMGSGINVLSGVVPASSAYGLGFIFPDYETIWRTMDGEFGAYLRNQLTKSGLVVMDKIWDNGFRHVTTSTRPINVPADLKNMKIRVPLGALWTSMFKAFGAVPTSINFNEVYTALQTKIVDGQETPLALFATANLFEVQKYYSLTGHMWDALWCAGNRRAWEALPEEIRQVVSRNINESALAEREDIGKLNSTLQDQLATKGMIFNTVDRSQFRAALREAGFYKEWKSKYGDELWSLLERSVGPLS
jgi:TRAP-type transport system periplasmic protein